MVQNESTDHIDPTEEPVAASLVGSLSMFSLPDVLALLASTARTGELQIVSDSVEGKLWLDDGELSNARVGVETTIAPAVFELACATTGWFYFIAGVESSSGQEAVPVATVLDEVRPQVDEWHDLLDVVPLDSVVSLSPYAPGRDVQIRNDQWHVLTTVGNDGHTVDAVLDTVGGDRIVALRTLRELLGAGLVGLRPTPGRSAVEPADRPSGITAEGPSTAAFTPQAAPPPRDLPGGGLAVTPPGSGPSQGGGERPDSLAEVAMMPPPIAADPWAPLAEPDRSEGGGVA